MKQLALGTEKNNYNMTSAVALQIDSTNTTFEFDGDALVYLRIQIGNVTGTLAGGERLEVDIYITPDDTGDKCLMTQYAMDVPAAQDFVIIQIPPFYINDNDDIEVKVVSNDAADSSVGAATWMFDISAQSAIVVNKLDHLVAVADSDDPVDNSIIAKLATKGGTANWSDFVNTTDSLQAIRDAIVDANPQSHNATANNESGNTTLDGGTFANTYSEDASYYQTGPGVAVGGFGLDCDLTFNIGTGRVPSNVLVTGYFNAGAQRTVQVWAYEYVLAAYVQLSNSSTDFGNAGSNTTQQYSLTNNMVQISDGEVKIRFTSTSETITDVWNCDHVHLTSVAQEAAGLTADVIQQAVWDRPDSNHDVDTLGFNLSQAHILHAHVVSVTNASQFIIDDGIGNNDAYNGMILLVTDATTGFTEYRRVINYIGATKEVFVDRSFSFTPATDDHIYLASSCYANVNISEISEDATAADNLEAILDGTGGTGFTLSSIVISGAAIGFDITGSTAAMKLAGGTTGTGLVIAGGSSSGSAIDIDSTSGDAIQIDAASGEGIDINATGLGISVTSSTTSAIFYLATTNGATAVRYSATGDNSKGMLITGIGVDLQTDITGTVTVIEALIGDVAEGQIVALDGGSATIAGMLNKMASDTLDGSDFDAGLYSQVNTGQILRADRVIDTAQTPWVVDYKLEGTETVLMSKTMKNTGGSDITSTNNVLGRMEQE